MTRHSYEQVATEDGEMPILVVHGNAASGAVLIVPSIYGAGDDLIEQMHELGEHYALVVVTDPFFRVDGGAVPYEEWERARARMQALDFEQSYRDFLAATSEVRSRVEGPLVGLGICFGGPFCLLGAADGAVDAVVTWHGSRLDRFLERAADIRCPLRFHFGDSDPVVPLENVAAVRDAFSGHDNVEVVIHEGATHGFSQRGARDSYLESAERAGMDAIRQLAPSHTSASGRD